MDDKKFWIGEPPTECDICGKPITDQFVDGATVKGPWACMDLECHSIYGVGLGLGRGQFYEKQLDGRRWLKVEG